MTEKRFLLKVDFSQELYMTSLGGDRISIEDGLERPSKVGKRLVG